MLDKKLTKAEYRKLNPFYKGYATYMQGAWNKNVRKTNPYKKGIKRERFDLGQNAAMRDCQDLEE